MQLDHVPLDELKVAVNNSRTHADSQVQQIAASITEFGFTNPLLVDEHRTIIAGHGRLMAARALGMTEVPCVTLAGLTDDQRRAYLIADNQLPMNADWDLDVLKAEVAALQDADFDLGVLGFDADFLSDLIGHDIGDGATDPDEVPLLAVRHVSKMGDVWLLGDHRVTCGDSTKFDDVDRLMAGGLADIVWTDPPYNVNYEGSAGKIENDNMADGAFGEFLQDAMDNVYAVTREGGAIYVAHADTEGLNFRRAFTQAGFKLSGCTIWQKDSLVLGRSDYQWRHEPILYGWKPGAAHTWYGGRKQTTILNLLDELPIKPLPDGTFELRHGESRFIISGADIQVEGIVPSVFLESKPKRNGEHPTMKPVALIERQLKNNAKAGAVVLDVFGGSGSTLIAAQRLGMAARLVEFDPRFCDVIVKRWQDYTNRHATLESTGEIFAVVGEAEDAG
jgi:DNA modification methylase